MGEYAERDIMADDIGQHYAKHVNAMTTEGLHAKSDIAAELAWRDAENERLRELLLEAAEDLEDEGVSHEWTAKYREAAERPTDTASAGTAVNEEGARNG